MRFEGLQLISFGMFSKTDLDLSKGNQGLHIIYGANEAGKSTAMRAIHHLLFGIPEKTPDAFLTPPEQLRIGGHLKFLSGQELQLIRRRGRSKTLRLVDDITIFDEAELMSLIGTTEERFIRLYGLSHGELVRGGADIVKGKGNLGEMLFSAGTGISDLRRIQLSLKDEAEKLYKPRGRANTIAKLLAKGNSCRQDIIRGTLRSTDWEKRHRSISDAVKALAEIEASGKQKRIEQNRLLRIKNAIGPIMLRDQLVSEHQEVEGAILLPDNFGQRREEAQTAYSLATQKRQAAENMLLEIKKDLDQLSLDPLLLEREKDIEHLLSEHSTVKRDSTDRLNLEAKRRQLNGEVEDLLASIRPELTYSEIETLRITSAVSAAIVSLGQRYGSVITALETSTSNEKKQKRRLEDLQKVVDSDEEDVNEDPLLDAISHTQSYGDLERNTAELEVNLAVLEEGITNMLARLTLWSGSSTDLAQLPVPQRETVISFVDRLDSCQRTTIDIENTLQSLEEEALSLEADLEEVRLSSNAPSEDELASAREFRDLGWALVLDEWKKGTTSEENTQNFVSAYPPSNDLAEAYPLSVNHADSLGDRMRHEASSVARKANLLARLQQNEAKRQKLLADKDTQVRDSERIELEWRDLWARCNIVPESPREMQTWLQRYAELIDSIDKAKALRVEIAEKQQLVNTLKATLIDAMKTIGDMTLNDDIKLSLLLGKATRAVDHIVKSRNAREVLATNISNAKAELEDARNQTVEHSTNLKNWKSRWASAVEAIGLGPEASPEEANAVLTSIRSLFEKHSEVKGLADRIKGINERAAAFSKRVESLVASIASDLCNVEIESAVPELGSRLKVARKAATLQTQLFETRRTQEQAYKEAETSLSLAKAQLEGLCELAARDDASQLYEAEQQSNHRNRLEIEIAKLEKQISDYAGGTSLNTFIETARAEDPDKISQTLEQLEEDLSASDEHKLQIHEQIVSERTILKSLESETSVPEKEQEYQGIQANLERQANHYIHVSLASRLLHIAIENYRERNKGPLLARSGEIFKRLTQDRYTNLHPDVDEKGNPTLFAVRANNDVMVPVERLSDGTADQLYLSLRLAGVELGLTDNEPIPLFLDDICIRFDDTRSAITLKILADISKQTQVIFFTHHSRLVALAKDSIDEDQLFIHQLSMSS